MATRVRGSVTNEVGEEAVRLARLHSLRERYHGLFGKNPVGPRARDIDWLEEQVLHADEIKRIKELRTEYVRYRRDS